MATERGTAQAQVSTGEGAFTVPLSAAGNLSFEVVGSKAGNLARLVSAGFPAPPGFVLRTSAFERAVQDGQIGSDADYDRVSQLSLPADVARELETAVQSLGDVSLAVRSSSVAEDLPDSSYAGQYETVLDVRGVDAVVDAVRRCWASAFSERAKEYRRAQGMTDMPSMAVLVQEMVPADAAGVAFTADPVAGDRDVVVLSAVKGLGDRLVSGEVTPDEWTVRDGAAVAGGQPEQAIGESQALEIAELARRVEEHFGEPQDIEWAVAGGEVCLLQARPITGLPQRPDVELPTKFTWMKDSSHYPQPMTPFGGSIYGPRLANGITTACREFGLMMDRFVFKTVGGDVYGQAIPVGEKAGTPPPALVMGALSRLVPAIRQRTKAARGAVRSGMLEEVPRRWHEEWRDRFRNETARLGERDMSRMSDRELDAHLQEAMDLLHWGQEVHFRLFIPYTVGVHELVMACQELLGWEQRDAFELVAGLSDASSEPARALRQLAESARQRPAVTDGLEKAGADVVDRMREADPAFADEFIDYLDRYGRRSISYDPGSQTFAERPELVAGLLRDALQADSQEDLAESLRKRRAAAEERARIALAGRSPKDRERFEEALQQAQATYPLREDNIFWTDNVPCGVIRRIALEIGNRLVARSLIRFAEDVVYLEVDEARSALQGESADLRSIVAKRRAEEAWVVAHPGPPFVGPPPAFPDLRYFPAEARRINGAFMFFMGQEFAAPREPEAGVLEGARGSAGQYTGAVRVIRSEREFDRLRPGEVLVCPITTPVWSVLFSNAGALVTDSGGALSHAAIVAREHGIPAVVGTVSGTQTLEDGQMVTVDGSAGRVEIHS